MDTSRIRDLHSKFVARRELFSSELECKSRALRGEVTSVINILDLCLIVFEDLFQAATHRLQTDQEAMRLEDRKGEIDRLLMEGQEILEGIKGVSDQEQIDWAVWNVKSIGQRIEIAQAAFRIESSRREFTTLFVQSAVEAMADSFAQLLKADNSENIAAAVRSILKSGLGSIPVIGNGTSALFLMDDAKKAYQTHSANFAEADKTLFFLEECSNVALRWAVLAQLNIDVISREGNFADEGCDLEKLQRQMLELAKQRIEERMAEMVRAKTLA